MRYVCFLVVIWISQTACWNCPDSPEEALDDLKYRIGEVSIQVIGGGESQIRRMVSAAGGDDYSISIVKEGKDEGILYADTPASFIQNIFNKTSQKEQLVNHPSTIRWYFHTDDENNTNVDGIIKFLQTADLIEPMKKYISKPTLIDWLFSLPPRIATAHKVNLSSIAELELNHDRLVNNYNINPHIVLLDTNKIGSKHLLNNLTNAIAEVISVDLTFDTTLSKTLQNIYTRSLLAILDRFRIYTACIEICKKRERMREEINIQESRQNDIAESIASTERNFNSHKENAAQNDTLFYQVQIAIIAVCGSGTVGLGYVSLTIAWPFVQSILKVVNKVYTYFYNIIMSFVLVVMSVWNFLNAPPTPGISQTNLEPTASFQPEIISLDLPDSLKRSATVRGAWRKAGKALYATRRFIKSVKVVSPIKKEELGYPSKVTRSGNNKDNLGSFPGVIVLERASAGLNLSGIDFLKRAINLHSTGPSTGDNVTRTASSLSGRGWGAAIRSRCSSVFSSASTSSRDLAAARFKIANLERQLQSQQLLQRDGQRQFGDSSLTSVTSHSTVQTYPITEIDVDSDDSSELISHLRITHNEN